MPAQSKMHFVVLCTNTLFFLFDLSLGHSWVQCADYDTSIDLDAVVDPSDYDIEGCNGWIRNWWRYYEKGGFGVDGGADEDITYENYACHDSLEGSAADGFGNLYNDEYHTATYTVGETVRILWPAKNHANFGCSQWDPTVPDHELQLYVNPNVNPTEDLGRSLSEWTLIKDWHEGYTFEEVCTEGDCNVMSHKSIDMVGFANCPNFCADTDKAICYGDFVVPNIFPEDGYYTFFWYWAFKANERFGNCFEVYVQGTQANSNPTSTSDTIETSAADDETLGSEEETSASTGTSSDDGDSLMWLVILLCIVVAVQCVALVLCGVKNRNQKGAVKSESMANVITSAGMQTHAVSAASEEDNSPQSGYSGASNSPGNRGNTGGAGEAGPNNGPLRRVAPPARPHPSHTTRPPVVPRH